MGEEKMVLKWSVKREVEVERTLFVRDTDSLLVTFATVDDLRRACEAAGLTLASAQHAEDLEKLGKEMAEVVAHRDAAREYLERARETLGSVFMDPLTVAARRVVAERDAAIARAEKAEAKVAELADAALDTTERDAMAAELAAIRAATGEEPTLNELASASFAAGTSTHGVFDLDASRRAVYNLGRSAAQGEVARMREEVAAAKAHAEPAYRTVKSIGEILSVEPDYEKVTDKVRDTANEVATLRDRVDGLEIDLNSAVQNSKANEVEANNLRSANRTLLDRVAELEAARSIARYYVAELESQLESTNVEMRELASRLTDAREAFDRVLRERNEAEAKLEAAPHGQPVATDEELLAEYDAALATEWGSSHKEIHHASVRRVIARVRAERPACLVARAVALGCDVWVTDAATNGVTSWSVEVLDNNTEASLDRYKVPAADVPATLARLLDEVEASRKAVLK